MNLIFKAYCRVYQAAFRLALPILSYRNPTLLRRIEDVPQLLADHKKTSVLLVTDAVLCSSPCIQQLAQDVARRGIRLSIYSKTCPNPTDANVAEPAPSASPTTVMRSSPSAAAPPWTAPRRWAR